MVRALEVAVFQSLATEPLADDVEADLAQDDPAPARQFQLPVKRLALVAGLLVAVVFVATREGDVQVASHSGSADQALDLKAIATLDTTHMDPKVATVMKTLGAWGKGLLHGDKCADNAKDIWTDNVVWDARGPTMLKKYEGIAGGCQFIKDLEYFVLKDFTVASKPYVDGDNVKLEVSYTPGIQSGLFMHKVMDGQIWKVVGDKVAGMTILSSEPQTLNALVGEIDPPKVTEDVSVVGATFAAWGKGEMSGEKCQDASRKFTHDDVMVNAAAPAKYTDMYKVYNGLDGWCEWIANLEKFAFNDFVPAMSLKAPGLVSVSVKYKMNLAGKKDGKPTHDLQLWSVKNGKIASLDFLFGDIASADALLHN